MVSLANIRTLLVEAWRTAASEPLLLVPGIFVAAVTIFESSYAQEIFRHLSSIEDVTDIPAESLWFFGTLVIVTSLLKTIAESQIFITTAARLLQRSSFLTRSYRIRTTLRYLAIEILCSSLILLSTLFLFPLLTLEKPSLILSVLAILSALFFFNSVIMLSILKHILFGYCTLSPLTLLSAFKLSIRLLSRYLSFSIIFLLILTTALSLFTFLQNLVILQGAFLYSRTAGLFVEILSYAASLLLGTFIAIFFTTVWVHWFLLLTNKRKEEKNDPVIVQEEIPEVPPVA